MVAFYEDFPYALWNDFRGLEGLDDDPFAGPAAGRHRATRVYADITDELETKIMGINLYESQIERLFDGNEGDGQRGPVARAGDRGARRRRWLGRALLGLRPRLRPARQGSPSPAD